MAKITDTKAIGYARRFNLGNYEHEEFTISTALETDDIVTEFARLKGAVAAAKEVEEIPWGETPAPVNKKDNEGGASAGGKKKPGKKPAKNKKEEEVDEEEEQDEEETEEEVDEEAEEADEEEQSEEDEEETIDEEEGEEEDGEKEDDEEDENDEEPEGKKNKVKAPAAKAGKKTFKKKGSVYSRANDVHKKLFVEAMNEQMGAGWVKKNAGRAKTVSIKLEGKDFLDAEGQVVDTFKAQLKKLAKA